jgi:hypothetical protein
MRLGVAVVEVAAIAAATSLMGTLGEQRAGHGRSPVDALEAMSMFAFADRNGTLPG